MPPRNDPDRIQIAFDDHRLVANAGLTLVPGNCPFWSDCEPLTSRAQSLAAQPSATFAPSHTRL